MASVSNLSLQTHVARWPSEIDPAFSTRGEGDGIERLIRFRAFCAHFGPEIGCDGFITPGAPDSIGSLLATGKAVLDDGDPGLEAAARFTKALFSNRSKDDGLPVFKIWLCNPRFQLLTPEKADKLDEGTRSLCVPCRRSEFVAAPIPSAKLGSGTVRVDFEACSASIEVKRGEREGEVEFAVVDSNSKKWSMSNVLPNARVVDLLFQDLGGKEKPLQEDAVKKVDSKNCVAYEMPSWLSEALASAAEEWGKANALVNAAVPHGVYRPFHFERGMVCFRHDASDKMKRVDFSMPLHKASGKCICAAHEIRPVGEEKQPMLVLSACGLPLDNTTSHTARCYLPKHSCCSYANQTFPLGGCMSDLQLIMKCTHGFVEGQKPRSLFCNIPIHETVKPAFEAIMACAIALARGADVAQSRKDMERVLTQVEVTSCSARKDDSRELTEEAIYKLRNRELFRTFNSKQQDETTGRGAVQFKLVTSDGKRLPKSYRDLETHHCHLFPYTTAKEIAKTTTGKGGRGRGRGRAGFRA